MRITRARLQDDSLVDVELADGRIAAIAPSEGAADADLDLDGRILVPGLWDEHVHLGQWAAHRRRVSVAHAASAVEAAAIVGAALRTQPADEPLVAVGMREGLWPDAPSRALLDAVAGDRAVTAISADLHATWSSSAMGRMLGVELPEDGMLREAPSFAAMRALEATVDDATRERWIRDALDAAASRGVVGLTDLDLDDAVGAWSRRSGSRMRIDVGVYPHDLDAAEARGDRTGRAIHERVHVGPLKVITDGSLGTRTAYCHDPYPDGGRGLLEVPPEQLAAVLTRGAGMGLRPAVHAIGDAALAHVLDVFEATGVTGRIEHAQLATDVDVARMGALGVTASIQPEHMLDDRELIALYWAGRERLAYRIRSLLDAGVRVILGSDAPVAPLDPWVSLSAAVTRTRDGDAPWQPHEGIDVATALACSTRSRIEVGEPADLVAIDAPLEPERLRTMPVALTIVGGDVLHTTL
ncbi:amidohydrolase [Agrococcus sp. SGAir0287]|uniref:amidohydrolase n=1 Tax=Agrococcus sp. SGAir0287 TaxID=2070347 RepID=UPI0020C82D95|nr:amidohydrolase family protein [Agrococcus sp. SGAir0287]